MNGRTPNAGDYINGVVRGLVPHPTSVSVNGEFQVTFDPEGLAAIDHQAKLVAAGVIEITQNPVTPYSPQLDDSVDPFVAFHTQGIDLI